MLTFLRKIRKSLIESSSAQKYILYAIGEIALVVIGILIALQINNWNESKKINRMDQEFLQKLINELIQDTLAFHDRKVSYSGINQRLTESASLLNQTTPLSNDQIEIVKRNIGVLEILTPLYKNISINNEEIATGRLGRINPEINNKYTAYIERYQSDFEVSSKFGESLQAMSIQYISFSPIWPGT